jgi:hypothetical protein
MGPLEEARSRAEDGPASSRAAWSLVAWALAETDSVTRRQKAGVPPATRPTLELIARLSDRPSADRDTTFLFRLARAGAASARPMLEALARGMPLTDEPSVRAALYLARDHGREDMRDALADAASVGRREEFRGMAAAALWDSSSSQAAANGAAEGSARARSRARDLADELVASRVMGNVAWGALIRAAAKSGAAGDALLSETQYRWIQWGWLE